ncbi:MAG TPA: helix-turn-helix transcriptional regulator, partial [Chitinophagaceae bacterium]|nr:helix-turn-helix transcriptional regulator [Chitinophagaceae bacterium]
SFTLPLPAFFYPPFRSGEWSADLIRFGPDKPIGNLKFNPMKMQTTFMPCICAEKAAGLLSRREREILGLIINGYTNSEIAGLLYVSCRTVDTHRQNMLAKLGARNTAVLVRFAVENIQHLGLN